MIQIIHKNAKAKIRTFGESEYFPIRKGVLQGECISAKPFTIFMDDLVKAIHDDMNTLSKNMYADDIVVLATNAFDLQNKIA
jgi:hypothetical protein